MHCSRIIGRLATSTWPDLMLFDSTDVATTLMTVHGIPAALTAPAMVKRLGFIVEYAQIGILTKGITMTEIIRRVITVAKIELVEPAETVDSPSRRVVQVFDKKAVPSIEKFTGLDEDYFAWRKSTANARCILRHETG